MAAKKETQESVLEENKSLKSELDDLKKLFQQFMESQNNQTNVDAPNIKNDHEDLDEEFAIIPPNKLINITSLFYGGMTLIGAHNKSIRFEKFGVTLPISFEDLTNICSNHRKLAEEGYFYIHNKDAIKTLYLSDKYSHVTQKQTIENLITLDYSKITDIYSGLTDALKETVNDIVIQGVASGDSKYLDRNKVDHLGKLSGKDLYKLGQDQIAN